ncbi:hypothetical protein AMEX_G12580 [Astyanax mexicanus]|uniref:Uncharacterized protein n=1 Tax=Astyanax mexicanus TaxID=7994 RepID=A0A8T2LRB2_ASTMX|nr:hypothetical protein AMEX_G12580 [Astyanax mexicanus]
MLRMSRLVDSLWGSIRFQNMTLSDSQSPQHVSSAILIWHGRPADPFLQKPGVQFPRPAQLHRGQRQYVGRTNHFAQSCGQPGWVVYGP